MGWDDLRNGLPLASAGTFGFGVFPTIDTNIEYEQTLARLPIAVVMLDARRNTLYRLRPFVPAVLNLLASPLGRALYVIDPGGAVLRLTAPS